MSLKRIANYKNSLSFRLALWYSGIFTLSSIVAFSLFYFKIASITLQRTDQELNEELHEFSDLIRDGDIKEVKAEIAEEGESEDESGIFFRLRSSEGNVLASTDMTTWGSIEVIDYLAKSLDEQTKYLLHTLSIPGRNYQDRIISGTISPNTILQIGISLEANRKYLNIFRNLFLWLVLVMSGASTFIGWFLARKSLSDMETITQTAVDITKGAYDKRVHVKNNFIEIEMLGDAFNDMLDRLQALFRGMREMVDNIAHDLRSPLARIRAMAEMSLTDKKFMKDSDDMAAGTIEECDNLIEMINTMLDITETEARIGEYLTEEINLIKLISDACELFRFLADDKNIRIDTDLPDECYIFGDKKKLQRVVTNLLENAIKYTETGGWVAVGLVDHYRIVEITFKDNGVGISEFDLPRIFERFYRADKSRSQAGIGLGLSLASAIANAFGGSITVKTALDEGSTFTLILPRGKKPE